MRPSTILTALILIAVATVLLVLLWPIPTPQPDQAKHEPTPQKQAPQQGTQPTPDIAASHSHAEQAASKTVTLEPEIRAAVSAMTNTSSAGLVEEARPDGSYAVDLQGRFHSVPVAVIGEDGALTIHEYSAPPREE